MTSLIMTLHIIVAFSLIGCVLMQRGQGADMGVSFGGCGAQTLFGSRGAGSFLGKVTGGLATTFMLTSLFLAFASQQESGSLVERNVSQPIPLEQPGLPASDAPVGFDPNLLKQEKPADDLPAPE
ncbi:MAG: preprotein translocase subunit SecG [Mariprofundaceae bacterium]